jgi:hypothetical protein
LRSLQEIQPDFVEEAKAYAGLWSQGKKERKKEKCIYRSHLNLGINNAINQLVCKGMQGLFLEAGIEFLILFRTSFAL